MKHYSCPDDPRMGWKALKIGMTLVVIVFIAVLSAVFVANNMI